MNTSPPCLTSSQEAAAHKLGFFYELQRHGIRSINGIASRPFGLIVGPSGIGKTFLVNRLAETQGLPLLAINIPNWIPRGALQKDQITLDQVKTFVMANDRGIIMIDELNKLNSNHTAHTSWSSDIYTECLAFLDQDIRLEYMGLSGLVSKLQRNFMVVGAAAFQDEWIQSETNKLSIGFQQASPISSREQHFEHLVRSQHLVPDELLFRFNDNLILIAPPTEDELAARISDIRQSLKLKPLSDETILTLVQTAQGSGKMMRWLEGYLSACLREIPSEALARFATPNASPEKSAPCENSVRQPKNQPALTALRDQCFDEYDKSLHELSRAARRLQVLLQSALSADVFSLGDASVSSIVNGIEFAGRYLCPEQPIDQHNCALNDLLHHLAKCALRVGLCSQTDKERAQQAGEVRHTAAAIIRAMPALLAYCGPAREGQAIKEAVFEFHYHSDHVASHLEQLRAFDA